jgi:hypothetical protein
MQPSSLQDGARARFEIDKSAVAAGKIANDLEHEDDQRDLRRQQQPIRQEARVPLLERRQEADFADADHSLSEDPHSEQQCERPKQKRVMTGNVPGDP